MIVNKVTAGFVIQQFDTETKKFLGQYFVAGDEVSFEDAQDDSPVCRFEEYLPFDMVQPDEPPKA